MSPESVDLTRRGLLAAGLGLGVAATVGLSEAEAAETVRYQYQVQRTQSWCSAAASRIAISAKDSTPPTQKSLAHGLGLRDGQGLQDPYAIARVLNNRLNLSGTRRYVFRQPAAGTLKERLRKRVVYSINQGFPVVINMNQVAGDRFSAGHYVTIVGYRPGQYKLADPYTANRKGNWYDDDKVVAWNKMNRFTSFGA